MHSLKNITPKKSDLKLPSDTKKTSPIKNQDGRDNVMVDTTSPKHMPHSSSWTKSVFKNDFIDAKSALLQQKQPSKGLIKRKVEKLTNETEKNKIKPAVSTSTEDNTTAMKKETKRKPAFPKTSASYVCKYCCRRFRSIELLRDHTSTHGNKPSYVCYLCGTEAGAFSSLMAHFVKHSRTRSILKTDKLKNKTRDLTDFVALSSPKSSIRCSHCKLSFPSTERLASHYCPIAGKKSEYNCAYCGQISSSIDDYRLHVLSHSVTPFLCMHCNFKGPTKKLLDKHLEVCKKKPKILNENLVFKCKHCSTECKHKKELNQHTKVCKQTSDCKVTFKSCPNCSSVFSSKLDFDSHVLSCSVLEDNAENHVKESSQCNSELNKESTQEESFLCSHCGEVFHDQTEHENHQVICFEDELALNERTSVLCQTCGGIFPAPTIKEHQKLCVKSDENEKSVKELDEETAVCDADSPTKRRGSKETAGSDVLSPPKRRKKRATARNDAESPSKRLRDRETTESDADSPSKRRSARLVRRKSSFSEDSPKCKDSPEKEKLDFQESKEARKTKISKTKNLIKVFKGRRGRQSKVGNANFKCNYCDLTFCSKSTLLRHKRMHSGNPYFSCKYCGKFFFRKDVYTRHEVNVHSKSTHESFSCYYCKLYFEDPLTLKEHVLATHKENAFLPVKTEFTGDINQDVVLSPLDIKKEPSTSEIKTKKRFSDKNTNSKNDIPNSSTLIKKCGICFETFKSISDIEKHLQSHKSIETLDISKENSLAHLVDQVPEKSKDISSENQRVDNGDLFTLDSSKVRTSTPAVIHLNNPLSNLSKQSEQSLIHNSDLDVPGCSHEGEIVDTNTEIYTCKLCLNTYGSKTLLTSHQSTEHKIIDWYQCLVCDTSGPKQDMIEHMFSHMYKVGSIVVSNTSANLDSLLPFMQNPVAEENQSINTNAQIENSYVIMPENTLDEVSRIELPTLIDYGSDSSNILINVGSFSDETWCQNKDHYSASDNSENNDGDSARNYFEDNALSQKAFQFKNNNSDIALVSNQVSVTESPCNELIKQASPQMNHGESSNPVNTNLLESSLKENNEQSKQFSKETLNTQNATPLSPKPLKHDSPKKLLLESSNYGNTNLLNSLLEDNSKLSQQFLEDKLKKPNTVPLSPKSLVNRHPKELHVDSSNCGNSKLLKSSIADEDSGLLQKFVEETLKPQDNTPLSPQPLLSLVSPNKMHVEPSNCVNMNLSKSFLVEENSKLPKQFPKETLHLQNPSQNITSSKPKPLCVEYEVDNSGGNVNKTSETFGDSPDSSANFSQLRYLLETFKKTDPIDTVVCSNKKNDEPNYQLHILEEEESCTDSCAKNDNLSWLNSLQSDTKKDMEMTPTKHSEGKQKNIDHTGFQSSSRSLNTSTSFNKLPSENTDHFSKVLPNSNKKHSGQQELNQSNTCLKFDINQSRSIFSENELFQTNQVQSKILDFSDLIGDTINLNNSMFQCDQVPSATCSAYIPNSSMSNKLASSNSNKSVFSPEVNKCNNCNLKFNDANELALHMCSKNLTFTNCINSYNFEPKNMYFPPTNRTNSPCFVDYDKTPTEKYIAIETINDIFNASHANSASNKMQTSHFEMVHINNSSSNHTCNNCYRTFCDVKDLAHHSQNCSKPSWCKNDDASDSLKFPETLHSLLAKEETRTQQNNYSISAENDTSYDTVLNLSKNPFSS